MISITVLVGKDGDVAEVVSAPSIREAIVLARVRHPEKEIRVAYPIDPENFFPEQNPQLWSRA